MEKQTKHRILGIVVLIGVIIILLPLFQSRKELRTDTSVVKAPPFPEQTVPSVNNDTTAIPLPTEQEPENHAAADKVNQQPDDTIQSVTPPASAQQMMPAMPETNAISEEESAEKKKITQLDPNDADNDTLAPAAPALMAEADEPVEKHVIKPQQLAHKPVIAEPAKVAAAHHIPTPSVVDLKESTWVVQIGSFKNKENALRLVNKLRAGGYRAFHQDMATADGRNTKVFVGPENKRNSARVMAIQLEKDLNLHGVILNYKPLEL